MPTATANPYMRETSYAEGLILAAMADAPAEVQEHVRRYPLSGDQVGYLRALAEYGYDSFVWGNNSTSERLGDALVKKGLAVKVQASNGGTMTKPAPFVKAAYVRLETERREAYEAQGKAEAEANRTKHAAMTEALEAEKALLLAGLALLAREGVDQPEVLAAARARVEGMSVATWQGRW